MSRFVPAILLAAVLMLLPALPLAARNGHPDLFESVRALSWTSATDNLRYNHCTTFPIGRNRWVTAAHCVMKYDDEGEMTDVVDLSHDYQAGTIPLSPTFIDLTRDLAGMAAKQDWLRPVFKLSSRVPEAGDEISIFGFPLGYSEPHYFHGYIAAPYHSFAEGDPFYTSFDMEGCGGNSGSPVVDSDNHLISVATYAIRGPFDPCSHLTGGVSYGNLKNFLQRFPAR